MKRVIEISAYLIIALFFLVGVAMLIQNTILLMQNSPDVNIEDPIFSLGIILASLCGAYHAIRKSQSSRFLLYGSVLSAILMHSITIQVRTFDEASVSSGSLSITSIATIINIYLFYLAYKNHEKKQRNT